MSQHKYSKKALTGRGDLKLFGTSIKLQGEVLEHFKKMQKEALKSGIKIQVVSGYRSYQQQLLIWNRKYNYFTKQGLTPKQTVIEIIKYSTIPGTSRHHWGTDIDVIDANTEKKTNLLTASNYVKNGVYNHLKKWMDANSEKFGFYLVYGNDLNRRGFKYEPWHYSYRKIAKPMLHQFIKLNLKRIIDSNSKLKGVSILTSNFVNNYVNENVLDINFYLK